MHMGHCHCQEENVDHLLLDGRTRFGSVERERDESEIKKKSNCTDRHKFGGAARVHSHSGSDKPQTLHKHWKLLKKKVMVSCDAPYPCLNPVRVMKLVAPSNKKRKLKTKIATEERPTKNIST